MKRKLACAKVVPSPTIEIWRNELILPVCISMATEPTCVAPGTLRCWMHPVRDWESPHPRNFSGTAPQLRQSRASRMSPARRGAEECRNIGAYVLSALAKRERGALKASVSVGFLVQHTDPTMSKFLDGLHFKYVRAALSKCGANHLAPCRA